ncbi:hypothetical protein B0H13DRAFT_2336164 [Mycena leptocephala]|nr:hypothetical protein B0H13DRAFT_2336164 [Mycena leptocephala]
MSFRRCHVTVPRRARRPRHVLPPANATARISPFRLSRTLQYGTRGHGHNAIPVLLPSRQATPSTSAPLGSLLRQREPDVWRIPLRHPLLVSFPAGLNGDTPFLSCTMPGESFPCFISSHPASHSCHLPIWTLSACSHSSVSPRIRVLARFPLFFPLRPPNADLFLSRFHDSEAVLSSARYASSRGPPQRVLAFVDSSAPASHRAMGIEEDEASGDGGAGAATGADFGEYPHPSASTRSTRFIAQCPRPHSGNGKGGTEQRAIDMAGKVWRDVDWLAGAQVAPFAPHMYRSRSGLTMSCAQR